MKSRRLWSVLLIVLMASVFFISCGIPTYLVPDASVDKKTSTSFSIKYKSENSGNANADNIGLLLFYCIEKESSSPIQDSNVKAWFKTNIRPNEYDGSSFNIEDDVIGTFEDTSKESHNIYCFKINKKYVSAPSYCLKLNDQSGPIDWTVDWSYDSASKTLSLAEQGSAFTLNLERTDNEAGKLVLFGAISVQSKNYSNIYWSDLKRIAEIEL